ncbi:MAG: hypothetical protein R3E31_02020 [Chloroflexota bacterium]
MHVSLTWAGLIGYVAAGLLGLAALAWQRADSWRQTVGWVAFGFYVSGVAVSALASKSTGELSFGKSRAWLHLSICWQSLCCC